MSATIQYGVAKALHDLASVFTHKWDHEGELAGYLKALADLPHDELVAACEDCARTEKYWPKPVVLRERVQQLRKAGKFEHTRPIATRVERWTNPATGTEEVLHRCADCEDTGWQPLNAHGQALLWQEVRSGLAQRQCVRKCPCGKLRRTA